MTFPIVAIGASAGGLEAVSELLAALPAKNDAAFVVIEHLDPDHRSLLSELLAKKTAMRVLQIEDGASVEEDHVYVIPPNTSLTLAGDRFQLTPRLGERPHHPVDVFFSSLAEARGDAAIGVVLSGGDADGSLGIQSIKQGGGITFAQQPETARVPSMPRNAIETGCVDFVMRPSDIARELTRLRNHPYLRDPPPTTASFEQVDPQSVAEKEFRQVIRILRSVHGVDFSYYKHSTLRRRLTRRMAVRKVERLAAYLKILEEEPAEAAALHQDFLIRVTSFFRDPESFEALDLRVLPLLCEGRSSKNPIRVWVPGCATGEEVYSLAIALLEHMGERHAPASIQIFGTDVSETAIERARAGIYLANIIEELSPERQHRFFNKLDGHYQVAKSVRDLCIFARQDVTRDPPFSRMDLISCRNLLIYLDSSAQRRVMQVFHYALRPHGFLVLGHAESIGTATDMFEATDKQQRIYTRRMAALVAALDLHQQREISENNAHNVALRIEADFSEIETAQREADRMLLALYAPASLLIDEQLNILQFRGETSPYVEHASGAPSFNLHRVVRAELLVALVPAIAQARESGSVVLRDGLAVDEHTNLTLRVVPLKASSAHHCYLILFEDPTRKPAPKRVPAPTLSALPESEKDRRIVQLERDLAATRDYMQSTIEEHEAVKEELKSAHEEVLSANEEFQSTNEELETSKEEMQSANEELITTNDELRDRNRELAVLNAELRKVQALSTRALEYADSIVRTVRDPLLVLDEDLIVRRANPAYYARFNAESAKTEGRSFTQIGGARWNDSALLEQLAAVLKDDVALEDYELTSSDPEWGTRVLRLNGRKIAGDAERAALILLAIDDVTQETLHAEVLAQSEERFRSAVEAVGGIVWTNNGQGEMEGEQPGWAALTGQSLEEYQRHGWTDAVHPEDAQPTLDAWREAISKKETFRFEHRVRRRDGEWRHFMIQAVPVFDATGAPRRWVGVHTDVTELRSLAEERAALLDGERLARSEIERANRVKDEFLATLSHELRTPLSVSLGWSRILLKRHGALNEEVTKGLKIIVTSNVAQSQIISDLLDISSISSGKTVLNLQPVDLNELIAQCVDAQEPSATDKKIALTLEQKNEPKVVFGDANRLQQVMGNLLTNALKFTPAGGQVRVEVNRVGRVYVISVQDTGEGLAPEFIPHVFDRFRQADGSNARHHGGLGLGLAIVKQLIDMHGGEVRAESRGRGEGARFTVVLPAQAGNLQDVETGQSDRWKVHAKIFAPDSLKGVHALIVEDEPFMREFTERILVEHGALTVGVSTGSEALAALKGGAADCIFGIIICDIGLPRMDGYELIGRIRRDLQLLPDRLPAVALTAFARAEDRRRALEAGFQGHLTKPFEASQLVAHVAQLARVTSSTGEH